MARDMARMDELSVDEQRDNASRGNGGSFTRRIEDLVDRATDDSPSLSQAVEAALDDLGEVITAAFESRQDWRESLTRMRDASTREIGRLQAQLAKLDDLLRKLEQQPPPPAEAPEAKVVVLDADGTVRPGPPVERWTEDEIREGAAGDFGVENEGSPGWFSAGRGNVWLNEASYVQFLKRCIPYVRAGEQRPVAEQRPVDEQSVVEKPVVERPVVERPGRAPEPAPKKGWRDYLK